MNSCTYIHQHEYKLWAYILEAGAYLGYFVIGWGWGGGGGGLEMMDPLHRLLQSNSSGYFAILKGRKR